MRQAECYDKKDTKDDYYGINGYFGYSATRGCAVKLYLKQGGPVRAARMLLLHVASRPAASDVNSLPCVLTEACVGLPLLLPAIVTC